MPSPFPGMDPYLESPVIWPDVHHGFISEIRATLTPSLRPRYVARVGLRAIFPMTMISGRTALVPDVRVETSPGRKGAKRPKTESIPVPHRAVDRADLDG